MQAKDARESVTGGLEATSITDLWLSRRALLAGAAAGGPLVLFAARAAARSTAGPAGLGFAPIPASPADARDALLADGHRAQVLLAWGDALHPGLPAFELGAQSAALQARRFGFNCDFLAWFPLSPGSSSTGLLCVNHEYTSGGEMFPEYDPARPTREEVEVEIAAHGMSIVELALEGGSWSVVRDSRFNRRITGSTEMLLTGPAAGSELLRAEGGARVSGMLNNCAGGKTPWGTVLSCEENVHQYFANLASVEDPALRACYEPYDFAKGASVRRWEQHHERFDLARHPREGLRFGWVVEIDPYDPSSLPRKRTALGRFFHEGATCGLTDDGRLAVYMGDDAPNQHVYKFVSASKVDLRDRGANESLLDEGTLYAARFDADGRGEWLPLVPRGPLAAWTQAEILLRARVAAKLLGATPMDRPEDVEIDPATGRVYVALTKNRDRKQGDGGANPRAENRHGHVLELCEHGADRSATRFSWSLFLLCGDPRDPAHAAHYGGADPERVSPISCPDNLAFDPRGNLWIATDGQGSAQKACDSLYAVAVSGPRRGETRRFFNGPAGSEICGPEFSPDGTTLFLAVQHPGSGGGLSTPTTTWPHGDLPRPAVLAIRAEDGGPIGG